MAKKADTQVTTRNIPTAPNPVVDVRMAEVAAQFGVTSEDLGELARIGADSMSRAMFEITRSGLAFLKARELLSLGHGGDRKINFQHSEIENGGGFVEWLNEHGLSIQRVYESMRIAKFVTQLPQDQRDDVLALGKVKVMLLASLPQEVIDQAAESGNDLIGKADLMTVAQLKEEIGTLKRREKNYEAEIEKAQLKLKRLEGAKKRLTQFEPLTEEIRAECMALQLEAELPMKGIQKLFETALDDNSQGTTAESQLRLEQVWIAAHIVAGTALDMLANLHKGTEDLSLPQRALSGHILTPAEAEEWLLSAATIRNEYEGRKVARQEQRDADKPRGSGRPKGSKNKASE